jgi:hypothetical protein
MPGREPPARPIRMYKHVGQVGGGVRWAWGSRDRWVWGLGTAGPGEPGAAGRTSCNQLVPASPSPSPRLPARGECPHAPPVGLADPPGPTRHPTALCLQGDAPSEGPRLATPAGFALMFRDSGGNHPVSIWQPIAPKGWATCWGRGERGERPLLAWVTCWGRGGGGEGEREVRLCRAWLVVRVPGSGVCGGGPAIEEPMPLNPCTAGPSCRYRALGCVVGPAIEEPVPLNPCTAGPCCRYRALGCVVVPAIEEPSAGVAACMRADLLRPSRFYDAPVWHGTSADNEYWNCFLYQVGAVGGGVRESGGGVCAGAGCPRLEGGRGSLAVCGESERGVPGRLCRWTMRPAPSSPTRSRTCRPAARPWHRCTEAGGRWWGQGRGWAPGAGRPPVPSCESWCVVLPACVGCSCRSCASETTALLWLCGRVCCL